MRQILGYILSPIHHIMFLLVLCFFHPLQWISVKFFGYSAHKKVVDVMNFFLVGTYYILGLKVSFTGNQNLPHGQPIIFVVNHQSMYDVPALIWFLRKYHAKFISKIELTKNIPSISFNLNHGGGANIDRKDTRQSITEILKLGQRMKDNNWSAVIFPEGTRSKDGVLKEFQVGGVATLLKKVPEALIVPVAICNSWKVVKNGTIWLMPGYHLKFKVFDAIDKKDKNVENFVAEAREVISNVLS